MTKLMILFLAVVALCVGTTAVEVGCFENTEHFHRGDWSFCQKITEDIFLYYAPFEEDGNVMLGFHATKDASGWTALAIAGNGGMKGASQIIVRRNETDHWIAEDRHSMDYTTPTMDESQDVKLLFADQTGEGETSWGVLIPINSCDENDYPIEDKLFNMHWALGYDHTFSFHSKRGQFKTNLLRAPVEEPSTDGLDYVDMMMPDVPVVLGEGGQDPTNPYICTIFDLDELSEGRYNQSQKIHITRFSPLLAEESKQYVHHMLLYACSDDHSGEGGRSHLSVVPECESMPRGCYEVKNVWALGGGDIIFPPDVALPANSQGTRWLALQVHYYNPNMDPGVVDASGFRAYFTTDLREQEAGFMVFNAGTTPRQHPAIPAGVADYHLPTFTIPSSCSRDRWTSPLNVMSLFHHMHLYGTKMEIAVERDGQNLGAMRAEKHFDFTHQSLEEPSPIMRTLFPGDQITVNCWYDTSGAKEDVSFGDLTQQEMCYGGALYWPRMDEDDYSYARLPDNANYEQCVTAATKEPFTAYNVSLCAQNLFTNVPKFLDIERWAPEPFGLLTACNGGEEFQELLDKNPFLCPPCGADKNCTAGEVGLYAQEYCVGFCSRMLNVTTYPDLSETDPYDAGTWGCPHDSLWFKTPPTLPEPPICEAVGNPEQVVALQNLQVSKTTSGASDKSTSADPLATTSAPIAPEAEGSLEAGDGPASGAKRVYAIGTSLLLAVVTIGWSF